MARYGGKTLLINACRVPLQATCIHLIRENDVCLLSALIRTPGRRLGLPKPIKFPWLRKGGDHQPRTDADTQYREQPPPAVRAVLEKENQWDVKFYKFAKSLAEKRLSGE